MLTSKSGFIAAGLVAVLVGRASAGLFDPPVTEVTAPSGKKGYSLKCSGFGRTIEDCYKKAGEICPNGYDIENTSRTVQGIPQATGSTIIVSKEYMLISCKDKAPDDGTPDQKSPPVQDQPAP